MRYSALAVLGFAAVLAGLSGPTVTRGELRFFPEAERLLAAERPQHPLAREFPIAVDATALTPPIVWGIPGVTEPIQSVHPLMSDKKTTLHLRPGRYSYMTTAFSFEFTVDLDGKLGYHKNLEQCVSGRGTAVLTVKCRRTQPF